MPPPISVCSSLSPVHERKEKFRLTFFFTGVTDSFQALFRNFTRLDRQQASLNALRNERADVKPCFLASLQSTVPARRTFPDSVCSDRTEQDKIVWASSKLQ